MMNIMEVNKRLRQRPPFQMIEKVLELTPGESARGTILYGTFPGRSDYAGSAHHRELRAALLPCHRG